MKKKIKINLSEEDLEQLRSGITFDWEFDGVEVHLYKGEEGEEDGGM